MTEQIFPTNNFDADNNQCDYFYLLNRLDRLIAQDSNCIEGIFPHAAVVWEHVKTEEGELHLHQQIVSQWTSEAPALSLPLHSKWNRKRKK
ncbi:MAG: hypothetical protein HYX67_06290 [Candidatus Melainabacteria bacterium]|nr:hypothetical protein [Candidatus Melainabacteria bacterium]